MFILSRNWKKNYCSFFSVFIALIVTLLEVSASSTTKLACTNWYIYDDPTIFNSSYDFPNTLSEALKPINWKLVSNEVVASTICSETKNLCAICADHYQFINGIKYPDFKLGDLIVTTLYTYFTPSGNDPSVDDSEQYLGKIKEKFTPQ